MESNEDVWDDTALLQAYDDAVKGKRRNNTNHERKQQRVVVREDADGPIKEEGEMFLPNRVKAPIIELPDDVDPELRNVLQAYFNAGFALGRYQRKTKTMITTTTTNHTSDDDGSSK